jgi:hypothetical protein
MLSNETVEMIVPAWRSNFAGDDLVPAALGAMKGRLRERVWWRIEGVWKRNQKHTKTVRTRARWRRMSVAWMSETRPNESGPNQAGEEGGRKRALTRRSSEKQERPEASESMRNAPYRR